jgi:hypothetical protein
MLFLTVTVAFAWFLTKIFWSDRVAKYSLILTIPFWLVGIFLSWEEGGDEPLGIGFALSLLFALAFICINGIIFLGYLFKHLIFDSDWKDPANQRAFLEGLFGSSSGGGSSSTNDSYGSYVIQYRDQVGGSWIDGPGSNDERVAESMFDRFIQNDSRSNRRCRLVHKVNGRVRQVLSTN